MGLAISLAPLLVITAGVLFVTGRQFIPVTLPLVFSILPWWTDSLAQALFRELDRRDEGVGGIVFGLSTLWTHHFKKLPSFYYWSLDDTIHIS